MTAPRRIAVAATSLASALLLLACAGPVAPSPQVPADVPTPLTIVTDFEHAGLRWVVVADDVDDPSRGVLSAWPGDTDVAELSASATPRYTSPIYDLWWAAPARLEAERELIVIGMWSERRRHRVGEARHRTVRVVHWDGTRLVELWRGSALARPMARFEVVDIDGDGIDELRVWERPNSEDGATMGIHRWTGFGFSRDGEPSDDGASP